MSESDTQQPWLTYLAACAAYDKASDAYIRAGCEFDQANRRLAEARRAAQAAAENLAVTWDDVPEVYRKHLRSPEESIRGATPLGGVREALHAAEVPATPGPAATEKPPCATVAGHRATLGSQPTFAQAGMATYGCGEN
jgi:hypothetical protein